MSRKNANGQGTIRKRNDGLWEARYTSGKDGKQKSLYARTQKEVRQKLTAVANDIDHGISVDPSRITVGEWLDTWLDEFSTGIRSTTRAWYRYVCEKHIKPTLGNVRLQQMSKAHGQMFVNHLLEDEGIAPSTAKTMRTVFSSALSRAAELELIRKNPMEGIKITAAGKTTASDEMKILDRKQVPAFEAALKAGAHHDIVMFALLTGMRAGELRGLRWQDCDLETGTVRISRQIVYADKAYSVSVPKSGHGRKIELPAAALALLKTHKKEQLLQRMKKGAGWIDDELSRDLVFRMPDGSHYKVRALNGAVKKAGEAAGIEGMSPHDLRHSFAVAALRAGTDVKSVQHILGHSSAAITMDIYAQYIEDMGKVAAAKINDYWTTAAE